MHGIKALACLPCQNNRLKPELHASILQVCTYSITSTYDGFPELPEFKRLSICVPIRLLQP